MYEWFTEIVMLFCDNRFESFDEHQIIGVTQLQTDRSACIHFEPEIIYGKTICPPSPPSASGELRIKEHIFHMKLTLSSWSVHDCEWSLECHINIRLILSTKYRWIQYQAEITVTNNVEYIDVRIKRIEEFLTGKLLERQGYCHGFVCLRFAWAQHRSMHQAPAKVWLWIL